MKAIILASGIGKRLQPLTNEIPKSMVKLNDKTLIEWQIDNLANCKIKDIVITTGIFEEKFKHFINKNYDDLKITYINNPQYDTTNYIYSLWLTKNQIDDDIILLHGDLIFDKKLLKKLINKKGNFVLVNKETKLPKKDFKAVIKNDRVNKIGVDFFTDESCLSMPLYKFLKDDFLIWIDEIEKEIKNGNLHIYAEDAFNNISDQIKLKPLYYKEELCMEIDTMDDLNIARKKIKKSEK